MKFLIHIPQLIFGGAEKVLVNFANELVERGHAVDILETYEKGLLKTQFDNRVNFDAICSNAYTQKYYASLNDIRNEKQFTLKFIKLCKLTFSKIVGYRSFAEFLAAKRYKKKKYDIAINYLEIDSPKFILNNINAKKHIQWYHIDVGNLDNPKETDRQINWYKKMDAIICVAESARKNFVLRYTFLENKTITLYNFFDTDTVLEKSKEHFSFNSDFPVLLSVGRMTPQKKYLRFLKVLKRLKDNDYNFEWHVLGTGYQYDEIKKTISDYKLEDFVFLHGTVDNPYKYMKHCDLFVLPSGWEGFPTVTIEAKILKKPVLATNVSGIREQMTHLKNGFIVENDENAIYKGLKFLLDNPHILETISSNEGMESVINNENKYNQFIKLCE